MRQKSSAWPLPLALALCTLHADAQTLRWANQGDPQTMDPHSQNITDCP